MQSPPLLIAYNGPIRNRLLGGGLSNCDLLNKTEVSSALRCEILLRPDCSDISSPTIEKKRNIKEVFSS